MTSDMFRPGSVASLAGATSAVVLITDSMSVALGIMPKWLPLALSLVISVIAYSLVVRKKDNDLLRIPRIARYTLVVVNGCLIYVTAYGVQTAVIAEQITVVEQDLVDDSAASETSAKVTWTSIMPAIDRRRISPARR